MKLEKEGISPVTFTEKGFINSKLLNQYDLDAQISILSDLLKSQNWKITDNKIIFTELIDDRLVKNLLKLFQTEFIINDESRKKLLIEHCEIFGIGKTREDIENSINKQILRKQKLENIISANKEFYSLNLTKNELGFDKEENYDGN